MEYYKLLRLDREPFSNSPDPDYFFLSREHQSCLQKLEVALRLKRGLNVVIGEVGTGKTTLCRELIRRFALEKEIETHLVLDPAIATADEFLSMLQAMLCTQPLPQDCSVAEKKEAIKQILFDKGVDHGKTVILIIDEGQKISPACLEILRELLNFETNAYKLLQIAIFAQEEFGAILEAHPNFADRINLLHHLAPMSFSDTRRMIHHRIKLASDSPQPMRLFTRPALWAIYAASKGYPRRIIHLCHQSVLAMIIQNRTRAGWALIRSCKKRLTARSKSGFGIKTSLSALILLVICGLAVAYVYYPQWPAGLQQGARLFPIAGSVQSQTHPVPAPDTESPIQQQVQRSIPMVDAGAPLISDAPSRSNKIEINAAAASSPGTAPVAADGTALLPPEASSASAASTAALNGPETIPMASEPASVPADPPPSDPIADKHAIAPTILGQVRVQSGDTLYKMITLVYGSFRSRYLSAVMEANPRIVNPDAIETDERILFPVIDFEIDPRFSRCAWVVLDQLPDLEQALLRLKQLSAPGQTGVRMIAGWSEAADLQVYLSTKGYFSTPDKARTFVNTLPEALAGRARIIVDWPTQTTLLGDPYIGGMR